MGAGGAGRGARDPGGGAHSSGVGVGGGQAPRGRVSGSQLAWAAWARRSERGKRSDRGGEGIALPTPPRGAAPCTTTPPPPARPRRSQKIWTADSTERGQAMCEGWAARRGRCAGGCDADLTLLLVTVRADHRRNPTTRPPRAEQPRAAVRLKGPPAAAGSRLEATRRGPFRSQPRRVAKKTEYTRGALASLRPAAAPRKTNTACNARPAPPCIAMSQAAQRRGAKPKVWNQSSYRRPIKRALGTVGGAKRGTPCRSLRALRADSAP